MNDSSERNVFPISLLYYNEAQYPDEVYMRQPINRELRDFTWKETMDQARRLVSFLLDQGLKRGDRVSILSKNCAEWLIVDFACMIGGFVLTPIYATQREEDIYYVLKHSGAKLIFVGKLDDWKQQQPGIPEDITKVSLPYIDQMPADYSWNDILDHYSPYKGNPLPDDKDLWTLVYTSGTTGSPKGVMYTYEQMGKFRKNLEIEIDEFQLPQHTRMISYLPLAHVAERTAIEINSLGLEDRFRFTIYFVESLETFADDLRTARPHLFFAVPRIWAVFQQGIFEQIPKEKLERLLRIPLLSKIVKKKIVTALGLDQCVFAISGAAPISRSTLEFFDSLGIKIVEGYAQTENTAYGTLGKQGKTKVGSVGLPRPGVDVKIADNGEILMYSPGNMAGYYKEEALTKESFTEDGYLKTGDMGYFDDEGYLYITGRVKEQFKTAKGEYITPVRIEKEFDKHPEIEQCCLVGSGLRQPVLL
ncbi:MAG: AMP-binding protein, partial [Coxiellaceae bacterium]|nr:AMP-binding protein [Coxiellaceae bacterium]